ncbi:MAG TPA: hypothetical protein VD947_00970 [Patescibacteria group bacterium]|nr:hypothetical protein [Patescibacteria group bacterium]
MTIEAIALPDKVVRDYVAYGDIIPPADQLKESYERLSTADEIYYRLAAGDVALDLATIDPDDNHAHIGRAEEQLETAIESSDQLKQSGHSVQFNAVALSAILKLTELPQWTDATAPAPTVTFDYEQILAGAMRAIPYANSHRAGASLTEFIPVLLVNRLAQYPMVSRLALLREDKRPREFPDLNPNWDIGISKSGNYISPEIKIQLKGNNPANIQAYNNAGVAVLRAPEVGIVSPIQVIRSCMKEHDPSAISRQRLNPNMKRFLTSGELDEITGKIMEIVETA